MATRPKARPMFVELKPDDIDGRYYVAVKISPIMPQEEMQRAQLAAAYRAPGVDGRPLMDDRTILDTVLEADHPDLIAARIRQQLLPASSDAVKKTIEGAAEWDWMQENPETVEKAKKQQEASQPNLTPDQLKIAMQTLMAHMDGKLPQLPGLVGATPPVGPDGQPAGAQPPQGPPGMSGGIPGIAPGGPSSAALPPQMQMSPENGLPSPVSLPSAQARRGKPRNK